MVAVLSTFAFYMRGTLFPYHHVSYINPLLALKIQGFVHIPLLALQDTSAA